MFVSCSVRLYGALWPCLPLAPLNNTHNQQTRTTLRPRIQRTPAEPSTPPAPLFKSLGDISFRSKPVLRQCRHVFGSLTSSCVTGYFWPAACREHVFTRTLSQQSSLRLDTNFSHLKHTGAKIKRDRCRREKVGYVYVYRALRVKVSVILIKKYITANPLQ